MKILADENVDRQIVEQLRHDGHSVEYVIEMERSISDDIILDSANREEALLLTSDKDFGELVYRQRRLANGVILIRLGGLAPLTKASIVSKALIDHALQIEQSFTVVTPGRIRIRPRK
ncbi:MAG TPA: DUF5615 family PIN-like protein [Chloroflexia bacterium]|nr:DUF5615 family PIN-like protein [Chloroflexia bacterium]